MNLQFLSLDALFPSDSAVVAGLNLLLQTTILLALGLLALAAARRHQPHLQTLISRATLIGISLSVLLTFKAISIEPALQVTLPAAPSASVEESPMSSASASLPGTGAVSAPSENSSTTHDAAAAMMLQRGATPNASAASPNGIASSAIMRTGVTALIYRAVLIVWLTTALCLLGWLLLCHLIILRLRLTSDSINEGQAWDLLQQFCTERKIAAPALLTHRRVSSPLLCGLWKPAILLPSGYEHDYDAMALRAVLLHELAHLQRRDLHWNFISRILGALLWPQPLIWALHRRQEEISEEACDNAVVTDGYSAQEYASVLVSLAERLSLQRVERTVGAGVVPFRSSLGRRVQQILSLKHGMTYISRRARAVIVCAALAAVAIVSFSISVRAKSPNAVDLTSPAATVKSFIAAFNKGDVEQLANCVYEPVPANQLEGVRRHLQQFPQTFQIKRINVEMKAGSEEATVRSEFIKGSRPVELRLRQSDGEWKLLTAAESAHGPERFQWVINGLSEPGADAIAAWAKAHGTGEITGRARWEDGRPAGNIQFYLVIAANDPVLRKLYWHRSSPALPPDLPRMLNLPVTTDAKGNFRATAVAGVPYLIVSSLGLDKQPTEWIMPQPQKVTLQKGTVVTREVIISRGSLLRAHVVAQDSGKPVPGVAVIAYPWLGATSGHPPYQRDITDASGQAKLRVAEGEYILLLTPNGDYKSPGFASVRGQKYSVDKPVLLTDGKVSNSQGKPLTIKVKKESTHTIEFRLHRYVQPAPAPHQRLQQGAAAAFTGRVDHGVARINGITVPPGKGSITGKVFYPDGRPVAGIRVMAGMNGQDMQALQEKYRPTGGKEELELKKVFFGDATTDRNGTYHISGLRPAGYRVWVDHAPAGWLGDGNAAVNVGQMQVIAATDLKLKRGVIIRGKIVDATSHLPLSRIPINIRFPQLKGSGQDNFEDWTTRDGTYALTVPEGTVMIRVIAPSLVGFNAHGTVDVRGPHFQFSQSYPAIHTGKQYRRMREVRMIVDSGEAHALKYGNRSFDGDLITKGHRMKVDFLVSADMPPIRN
jgi:beta-lactamase regulating signal transducer with metallopeptidase domain